MVVVAAAAAVLGEWAPPGKIVFEGAMPPRLCSPEFERKKRAWIVTRRKRAS